MTTKQISAMIEDADAYEKGDIEADDRMPSNVRTLAAEVERLRGLLREADKELRGYGHNAGHADCKECQWRIKVREALK